MSNKLAQIQALAQQQAAVAENMNEVEKGGGGKLLPKGRFLGRIVEYIDCGVQPQEFQGKAKEPAAEFRLGVALWGEGVSEPDGSPYVLRPFPLALSRFERSTAYKAFKALNWQGNAAITHFAQFVGMPFIFTLDHHTSKQGKVSSIIKWELTTGAVDPISGQPYPVPEVADDLYRVFLWDFPTLEDWDALHIDGTNDDGKSKNFIQEQILGALNFKGSPLEQLFLQSGKAVPAVAQPAQASQAAAPVSVPTQVPQTAPAAAPAAQQVAAPLNAPAAPAEQPAQGAATPVVTAAPAVSAPSGTVQAPATIATTASPSNPAAVSLPNLPQL